MLLQAWEALRGPGGGGGFWEPALGALEAWDVRSDWSFGEGPDSGVLTPNMGEPTGKEYAR